MQVTIISNPLVGYTTDQELPGVHKNYRRIAGLTLPRRL